MALPLVFATATAAETGRLFAGLQRLCFWSSVLLPTAYLPILYSLDGSEQLQAVTAVVAVHALFLLVSRNYPGRR